MIPARRKRPIRERETEIMTRAASRYVHGTSPEEQGRLSRLNAMLNETCASPDSTGLIIGATLAAGV